MSKLSVVITAFNEEKKIKDCLESVKDLADEMVFVDNSSTDKTREIAQKYTKKIYTQKNDPQNIDLQKNFGFSKASGDWILSLDADERMTPELAKELKEMINDKGLMSNSYWIPRKNIIFGKWIEHTGWWPDYQLRLFKKGKGKYIKQHYHEDLQIDGETAYLKEHMLHLHYAMPMEFINRTMAIYVPNEAEDILHKGYRFDYLDVLRFPVREFLSRFFAREGYKDGLHGLVLSLLMGWYHFMIFLYIWEKKKFIEINDHNFLDTIERESKKNYKEMMFWFYNEKIKQSRSLSKKYLLKLKRKLS